MDLCWCLTYLSPVWLALRMLKSRGVHIECFGSMLSQGKTNYIRPYIPLIPNKYHYLQASSRSLSLSLSPPLLSLSPSPRSWFFLGFPINLWYSTVLPHEYLNVWVRKSQWKTNKTQYINTTRTRFTITNSTVNLLVRYLLWWTMTISDNVVVTIF